MSLVIVVRNGLDGPTSRTAMPVAEIASLSRVPPRLSGEVFIVGTAGRDGRPTISEATTEKMGPYAYVLLTATASTHAMAKVAETIARTSEVTGVLGLANVQEGIVTTSLEVPRRRGVPTLRPALSTRPAVTNEKSLTANRLSRMPKTMANDGGQAIARPLDTFVGRSVDGPCHRRSMQVGQVRSTKSLSACHT